jgi:glycosyltransferase involved in cell wall biosynthesis
MEVHEMVICLDARSSTPHFPGIGRYAASLAAHLPLQLLPGELLVVLHQPEFPVPAGDASRVHLHPCPVSPFSIAQQWRLPRKLARLGISLYHSPYYLMPYKPGVSAVVTIHDLIPLRLPGTVSPRARLFFRLATMLALHSANQVITISTHTRDDIVAVFGSSLATKIHTIPLAAGPQFFPQPPDAIRRVRQKYHLPDTYVLYLGSNKPHKNLVRLLHAWKGALEQLPRPPDQLVIAGAWDERYPEPRQTAEEIGLGERVRFLGPIAEADLPGLYSGAKTFVFPSLYEGFGLPVLEALACGVPTACSNTSSLPEAAGPAAEYFDPHHVEAITAALVTCMDDRAQAADLREKRLAQARQFTWEKTAQATLDVYHLAV